MLPCPSCGAELPDKAKFCSECGNQLASRPAARGEERKIVSVLFCDLVGFTERSDRADPEDVRAALRPYHSLLRKEIEGYGGTVEKFIGDAAMAVFGAPVAHEDDSERAVRAALRILEAIGELNASSSLGIAVRIGINTGEALVALDAHPEHGETIVTGDVVNTAARLQTVAPVGGIVVGEQTYRTTSRIFDYIALPPVQVKGKSEPLLIWQPTAARARFGVDVARATATAFIGREDELELLKRTYGRSVREPSVQLVTITGEPGVGKTRLVAELSEFIESLPDLVSWRQGRSLPYGDGITFWALGEIVKAQSGIFESDDLDEARSKLGVVVEAFIDDPSDREWILSQTAALVGLPVPKAVAEAQETETFTAWQRLLEAIAAKGPLVLVFEDIHWADEALFAFLEHLLDWSTGVSMLVVCTARPELFDRRPGWGGGKRNSATISLGPLTHDETTELVAQLLARSVLPDETQSLVLERSGGNPLYAEEFVRMLKDRGILSSDSTGEIPVPESVQALIAARLDALPADRKSLLQDASVVGKVFWSSAVAMIGSRSSREVQESLHELASKELVRPIRVSSVKDEAEWAFWHALERDVAYSQIPRTARAQKHQAAADWIEDLAGERSPDHAEVLAHHYLEALTLTEASGLGDVSELRERACRWLLLAGERAQGLDPAKAKRLYGKAVELSGPDDPARPRALLGEGEAEYQMGRVVEAEKLMRDAIDAFDRHGDRLLGARARLRLSSPLGHLSGFAAQNEVLTEAIELLQHLGDERELALAYGRTSRTLMLAGRSNQARDLADKALAISERYPSGEADFTAMEARGFARFDLGDIEGTNDVRSALDLALKHGTAADVARIKSNLAEAVWLIEGPAKGTEHLIESAEYAAARGLRVLEMQCRTFSTEFLGEMGDWERVFSEGSRAETWYAERGARWDVFMARVNRARVMVLQGRTSEASAIVEEVLPFARETEPQLLVPALVTGALAALYEGDLGRARASVEELAVRAKELPGARTYTFVALPDILRVEVATGDSSTAASVLDENEKQTIPRFAHAVATARAILAEARRDFEDGARKYIEAVERWTSHGHVVEQAQCSLGAGRCLLEIGGSETGAWLNRAHQIFARLGARPLLAMTEGLLSRAGIGTS